MKLKFSEKLQVILFSPFWVFFKIVSPKTTSSFKEFKSSFIKHTCVFDGEETIEIKGAYGKEKLRKCSHLGCNTYG